MVLAVVIVAILCIPVTCIAFAYSFRLFFADLAGQHHKDIAAIMKHLEETQQIGGTPVTVVRADRDLQAKDSQKKYDAAIHEKELQYRWQVQRLQHETKDPELEIVGAKRRNNPDEEQQRQVFGD